MNSNKPIGKSVRIGHVHLKVADLERALEFYCGVLGFETMVRFGRDAAFVSAGGYHHHIGLNTWESLGGSPPPPGATGLYHLAILYPTRAELAEALTRLIKAGIALDGASDHGVSEALYLRDPDQNGIELYWDRPQEQWPRSPDGRVTLFTRPLDLNSLLAELSSLKVAKKIATRSRRPANCAVMAATQTLGRCASSRPTAEEDHAAKPYCLVCKSPNSFFGSSSAPVADVVALFDGFILSVR